MEKAEGIVNLYKPWGLTSHEAVTRVRRMSGQRRAGHAGSLDPAAEGVLLVCLGQATRLVEFLMEGVKLYCAEICLGIETDTYDSHGQVVWQAPEISVDKRELEEVLDSLRGWQQQVPPMYSALKRGGIPLYRLARAGQQVEREPRQVEIYSLRLTAWEPPVAKIEIACSKGTYIRSLAHEIGQRLGCGAYLSYLVRLASGPFSIDQAVPLSLLADAFAQGYWQSLIYPMDEALLGWDAIILSSERWSKGWGQSWATKGLGQPRSPLVRVYSTAGSLVALAEQDGVTGQWRPRKVFAESLAG